MSKIIKVPIHDWQEYDTIISKELSIELTEDNLFDKDIIFLLSEAGSGKSTVINNLDAKSVGMDNKLHGFGINRSFNPFIPILKNRCTKNGFIPFVGRKIYNQIGSMIREIKAKNNNTNIPISNIDEFSDITHIDDFSNIRKFKLSIKDLMNPILNNRAGYRSNDKIYFDRLSLITSLSEYLKNDYYKGTISLGDFGINYQDFTSHYIQKYYEKSLINSFSQGIIPLPTFIHSFLHLKIYQNELNYLEVLDDFARDINITIKNNYPTCKFTLIFEEKQVKCLLENGEEKLIENIILYVNKYNKKYTSERLSDSEKAILWFSLLKTTCNKFEIDLSKSLVVFDEPDAGIDPQFVPQIIEMMSNISKKVVFSSHSFIAFKHVINSEKLLEKIQLLKSEIDYTNDQFLIKLTKIPYDNKPESKKQINNIMQRLSGGFTISDDVNSYLCTFDNIYEDNIVGCEGITDSAIFNLAKKLLLKNSLVDSNLKTFLEETKFLSFYDNGYEADGNGVGGSGQLAQIMKLQSEYLKGINKKIVAIFDFDQAGIKSARNGILSTQQVLKGIKNGELYNWEGKANKFFYLLQQPEILKNKNTSMTEYQIEHLIYGKGISRLDIQIDNKQKFTGNKTELINKIKVYLQGKNDEEILDFLSEFVLIFEKLFESLKN